MCGAGGGLEERSVDVRKILDGEDTSGFKESVWRTLECSGHFVSRQECPTYQDRHNIRRNLRPWLLRELQSAHREAARLAGNKNTRRKAPNCQRRLFRQSRIL